MKSKCCDTLGLHVKKCPLCKEVLIFYNKFQILYKCSHCSYQILKLPKGEEQCKKIVSQCRCMSKDKPVTWIICDECQKEPTPQGGE